MKKRVALIGAWGYGNVGDDAYPLVWRRYFPDVEFILLNSDIPTSIPSADLYLFGGGGIVFDNGTAHFEYMATYVTHAKKVGKPYGFLSVGVQARVNLTDNMSWYLDEALARWAPLLVDAALVTVRDTTSLLEMQKRGVSVEWFPDLCYLSEGLRESLDHLITIIPGPGVAMEFIDFREKLEAYMVEFPSLPLVVMNTGAEESDYMVDEVTRTYPSMASFKARHTTPQMAQNVIRCSQYVFTGRYHGLIFARAAHKNFWKPRVVSPLKMIAEDTQSDMTLAYGHVAALSAFLGVPAVQGVPENLAR